MLLLLEKAYSLQKIYILFQRFEMLIDFMLKSYIFAQLSWIKSEWAVQSEISLEDLKK